MIQLMLAIQEAGSKFFSALIGQNLARWQPMSIQQGLAFLSCFHCQSGKNSFTLRL